MGIEQQAKIYKGGSHNIITEDEMIRATYEKCI